MSAQTDISSGFQTIWQQTIDAFPNTVYVENRTASGGVGIPGNYNETGYTTTSGAYTCLITGPSQRTVVIEPGHYLDEYRQFHFASGALMNQFDWIQIAGTSDKYVVVEPVTWYVTGVIAKMRVTGRRIKTS